MFYCIVLYCIALYCIVFQSRKVASATWVLRASAQSLGYCEASPAEMKDIKGFKGDFNCKARPWNGRGLKPQGWHAGRGRIWRSYGMWFWSALCHENDWISSRACELLLGWPPQFFEQSASTMFNTSKADGPNSLHKLRIMACKWKKQPGLTSRLAFPCTMPKNICQRLSQKFNPDAA